MTEFLFLDLDDTILDFHKAERIALSKTLRQFGVEPTEEVLALYHKINLWHWEQLEKGKLTRDEVQVGRFAALFRELGVSADAVRCTRSYEGNLAVGVYIEKLRPGILKDGAHLCGDLIHGQVADFLSVHQHTPLKFSLVKLWNQAVYQPCDRCFSTPATATEQDTFPVCNFQADSMQTTMLLSLIRK